MQASKFRAYNSVLELSLDSMRPTRVLVDAALQDPDSLTDAELQQLAYYSWYDGQALPEGTSPEIFNILSAVTSDRNPPASARFYLQYLTMLTSALDEDNAMEKADSENLGAHSQVSRITARQLGLLIFPEAIIPALGGDKKRSKICRTGGARLCGRTDTTNACRPKTSYMAGVPTWFSISRVMKRRRARCRRTLSPPSRRTARLPMKA